MWFEPTGRVKPRCSIHLPSAKITAGITQLVECLPCKQNVTGSIPVSGSTFQHGEREMKKFLALLLLGAALVFGGCTVSSPNIIVRTIEIDDSDVDIQADGAIIISGGVDEDTFKEFRSLTLDGRDHYTIILMTNGGCGYNTVAIMNRIETLQKQGVKFTTYITGHGHSAGSYIFMMGDERIVNNGSVMMWHTMNGQLKHDNRKIPEERQAYMLYMDEYVVNKFRERFPHIKEEWIKETFWDSGMSFMTATSAKLMGIATKIVNN